MGVEEGKWRDIEFEVGFLAALRQRPAKLCPRVHEIGVLGAALREFDEGHGLQLVVGQFQSEAVTEAFQAFVGHFLGLMRDHLAFA